MRAPAAVRWRFGIRKSPAFEAGEGIGQEKRGVKVATSVITAPARKI